MSDRVSGLTALVVVILSELETDDAIHSLWLH